LNANLHKYIKILLKVKGNGTDQYYMLVLKILRIWLIKQQDCGLVALMLPNPGDYHDIQLQHISVEGQQERGVKFN
jgi:hypothetical protein